MEGEAEKEEIQHGHNATGNNTIKRKDQNDGPGRGLHG
jgi:hypothetical protein